MERSLCAGRIPHPPGSRRRERPPYGAGETRRPTGKMQFPRCTVGADSISARFAAARVRGRGTSLPYMPSGNDRPNGIAAAARANVGRDALIPPGPAARQTPAGGINPAPTANGRSAAKREPRVITNLCRGRCLHCVRRRVSEAKGRKARLLGRRSSRGTLPHRKPFVFEFAEVRRAKSPALPCKANALRAVEKHLFRQPVKGKRRPFLRTPFAFGSVAGGMPAGKRKSGEKTLHHLRPYQAARARPRSRQRPRASSSGASLTIRPLSS